MSRPGGAAAPLAYINGIGELPQGRSAQPNPMALHAALVRQALADAGVEPGQIGAVLTVAPRADAYLIHAAALSEYLDLPSAINWTLEAGGAAPSAMLETASGLLAAGKCEHVLIVAADMPLSGVSRDRYVGTLSEAGPVHPEYEVPFGPSVPAMFALVARAHAERWGDAAEALAAVALQNRRWAGLHPNAHLRSPMTRENYDAARMIAEPLRLLDCAPVSDGGGALVVSRRPGPRGVPVLGTGFSGRQLHLSAADSLLSFQAGRALDMALGQAGLGREHIDIALIYDCFTIAMLINLEDLGLSAPGCAGPDWLAGRYDQGGPLPVNMHGGLLSHGHPARAGGIGNVIEAVLQLRGEAGARQQPSPRVALAHGMGGVFASHGVSLLGAPR